MPTRALILAIIAALTLLAACTRADPNGGPPNGNGEPALGQADLDTAVMGYAGNVEAVGSEFMTGDAVLAMEVFMAAMGGFTGVVSPPAEPAPPPADPALPPAEPTAVARSLAPPATQELPRGVLAYDPMTGAWDPGETLDTLEFRWSFLDADETEREAVLAVDWGTTTIVEGQGGTVEVPTDDMSVTLTVDDAAAAAFDVAFTWYAGPGCADGILEPTSVAIDGSMGTDATLSLNGVSLSLTATTLDSSGEIVAAAGGDAVGVDWDVTLDVMVDRRPDCSIEDFAVDGGSVSVTLFSDTAGTRSSLGLNVDFGNIQFDEESGSLESIDLDGSLDVDGAPVVSFTGTLDDADGDGIPGENLILTFADGETMTFAAFSQDLVGEAASVVARALSVVR